jgi:hypothetical protein
VRRPTKILERQYNSSIITDYQEVHEVEVEFFDKEAIDAIGDKESEEELGTKGDSENFPTVYIFKSFVCGSK